MSMEETATEAIPAVPWFALSDSASGEGCGKDVAVAAVVVLLAVVGLGLAWLLG